MTHTLFSKGLHLTAAFALIAGISLNGLGAQTYAALSNQGTDLLSLHQEFHPAPALSPVDTYKKADAAVQLTLGILLIILGFFIHGLARFRDERPVHITVKPAKKTQRWYWIEMWI